MDEIAGEANTCGGEFAMKASIVLGSNVARHDDIRRLREVPLHGKIHAFRRQGPTSVDVVAEESSRGVVVITTEMEQWKNDIDDY